MHIPVEAAFTAGFSSSEEGATYSVLLYLPPALRAKLPGLFIPNFSSIYTGAFNLENYDDAVGKDARPALRL